MLSAWDSAPRMALLERSTLASSRPNGEGLLASAPLNKQWRAFININECVQQREEKQGWGRMQQSIAASVELRIHNGRDFYVEGDAICGDVLLAAPPEWRVHSLRVEILCTEHVKLPGHVLNTLRQYRHATHLLSDKPQSGAGGSYKYTVTIPDKHGYYPPSLDVAGAPECGIRWRVRALAEFAADGGSGRQTRKDVLAVRVLHKPTEQEILGTNKFGCSENSWHGVTYLLRVPSWLPQAPNLCSVELGIQLEEPAVVSHVSVYLETCVVMWLESNSQVYRHRECLETVVVNREVETLELSGASRGWRLKGPLVPAFRSVGFCVQYNLYTIVDFRDRDEATFWWRDIRMSSPAAAWDARNIGLKSACEACGAAVVREPPAYSETEATSLP